MKLTPLLLSQIIDENDIENIYGVIGDEMVIQVKAAYSISNQQPARDNLVIEWLKNNAEFFQFSYNQLIVRNEQYDNSYYDWAETDDCVCIALDYGVELKPTKQGWHAQKGNKYFTHKKLSLAILGVVSQLDKDLHAYAS
jgi:hypothetical protein